MNCSFFDGVLGLVRRASSRSSASSIAPDRSPCKYGCLRSGALVVLLLAAAEKTADAQVLPRVQESWVQTGVAAVPGVGLQLGYVAPRSFYTMEGIAYADATPRFSGGEGSVQVSLGLGGAIRPLGVMRTIGNTAQTTYDLDVGLRVGPSLFFPYGESSRVRNPFSLFIEPYVRLTSLLPSRRTIFAEAGLQRPVLRAGIWVSI